MKMHLLFDQIVLYLGIELKEMIENVHNDIRSTRCRVVWNSECKKEIKKDIIQMPNVRHYHIT